MKIKHIHVFFAIVIILGGGIWLSSQLDLFATTRSGASSPQGTGRGRQTNSLLEESSESASINISSQSQDLDKLSRELNDVTEIRGSFTLNEVEQLYSVPSNAIIEAFGLSKDTNPVTFRINNLKEIYQPVNLEGELYEVETDTVKVFVSLYAGIPYISEETFYLPEQAVNYLINTNKLTGEKRDYWESHTFDLLIIEEDSADESIGKEDGESYSEEEQVKTQGSAEPVTIAGRTTIAELAAMGIDKETFQILTGLDFPDQQNISVRDYAISNGIDFGEIRGKLESYLSAGNQ